MSSMLKWKAPAVSLPTGKVAHEGTAEVLRDPKKGWKFSIKNELASGLPAQVANLLPGVVVDEKKIKKGSKKNPASVTIPLEDGDKAYIAAQEKSASAAFAAALESGDPRAIDALNKLFKEGGGVAKELAMLIYGAELAKIERDKLPFKVDGAKLLEILKKHGEENGIGGAELAVIVASIVSSLRYPIGMLLMKIEQLEKDLEEARSAAKSAASRAEEAAQSASAMLAQLRELINGGTGAPLHSEELSQTVPETAISGEGDSSEGVGDNKPLIGSDSATSQDSGGDAEQVTADVDGSNDGQLVDDDEIKIVADND